MKEVKSSQESFIFINVLTLLGKQIGVSKALAVSGRQNSRLLINGSSVTEIVGE